MEELASTSQDIDITSVKSILNLITGSLSLFASIWVFHFYSKTYTPRPVSLRLILALSITDFVFSVANIISVFDANLPALCTVEAILRASSVMGGLYWASCIAILTYLGFAKGRNFDQDKFYKKCLVLGCTAPILISLIPFVSGGYYSYGPQTFGCYVVVENSADATHLAKLMLIMIFDGIPVIIALAITLIVYGLVAKKLNDLSESLLITSDIEIKRLFWYPAVLFLAYIPSFIDNVIELYIASAKESQAFTVVHIILTHSVGFTNGLVYGFQRKKYYEVCEKPQTSSEDQTADLNAEENRNITSSVDDSLNEVKQSRIRRSSDYEELLQARTADLL